jgi:Spy/CpxP family protein refolding chaperone
MRNVRRIGNVLVAAAVATLAAALSLPGPAHAQFGDWGFGGGWGNSRPY